MVHRRIFELLKNLRANPAACVKLNVIGHWYNSESLLEKKKKKILTRSFVVNFNNMQQSK